MPNVKNYDYYFVMAPISIKYPSGGTKIIYELARGLNRSGYKVAIHFVGNPWKVAKKYFPDREINEWPLKVQIIKSILNSKAGYRFIIPTIRKLLKIQTRENFAGIDLYFSKEISKHVKIKRMIATDYITAFFVDNCTTFDVTKYYLTLHDESDKDYLTKLGWLASEAYKLNIQLIVINDETFEKFKQRKPLLFYVGISDEYFKSELILPKANTDPIILMPVRLGKMKGTEYGIEALRMIHAKYPFVKIRGFGNVSEKSVPDFIEYYYRPPNNTLIELYRESTIFVLPSLIEGMSLPTVEAMALGCAIVSTDCVGINVFLKNGENGLIVEKANAKALFEAISELIEKPMLLEKFSINGKETANRFTYSNMVYNFVSITKSTEQKYQNV